MARCTKCFKEQMIMLTLEGKPYCYDCLKNVIKSEPFWRESLKKRYPDRDWDNIKINIK